MAARSTIDIERMLAHLGSVKLAYSVDDLAALTPLSRFFWYSAINADQLPAVKANDKTIVLLWDLITYLDSLPTFASAPGKENRAKRAATLRSRRVNHSRGASIEADASEEAHPRSNLSAKTQPTTPDGPGGKKEVGTARL